MQREQPNQINQPTTGGQANAQIQPQPSDEPLTGGISDKSLAAAIEDQHEAYVAARRKMGERNMLIGGLLCAGGLILTIVTYNSASESGGVYFIAWGPVIFGAIRFFRGLSQRG